MLARVGSPRCGGVDVRRCLSETGLGDGQSARGPGKVVAFFQSVLAGAELPPIGSSSATGHRQCCVSTYVVAGDKA